MTAGTTLGFLRGRGAPSDAARTALRRKIDEILEISGQKNWDGEGALAVAPRTAAIARTLTAWIPGGVLAPNADLEAYSVSMTGLRGMRKALLAGIAVAVAGAGACNNSHTYEELPVIEELNALKGFELESGKKDEEERDADIEQDEVEIALLIWADELDYRDFLRDEIDDLLVKYYGQEAGQERCNTFEQIVIRNRIILRVTVQNYEYMKIAEPHKRKEYVSSVGNLRLLYDRVEKLYEEECL